jgi:integrase/recombinase XerD
MNDRLGDFLIYLAKTKGSSENTVTSYKRDIKKLIVFLHGIDIEDFNRVTHTHLNAFLIDSELEFTSYSALSLLNKKFFKSLTFALEICRISLICRSVKPKA